MYLVFWRGWDGRGLGRDGEGWRWLLGMLGRSMLLFSERRGLVGAWIGFLLSWIRVRLYDRRVGFRKNLSCLVVDSGFG